MARTTGFLKGTVGAGDFDNRRDDVIALKRRLHALGLYEPPPEGFGDDIDAGFDRALRAFQEKHGLRVDGYSAPGGETERNVEAVRTGRGFDPGPSPERLVLEGSVGDGGDNRPADVVLVKRALGAAGLYPYDRTLPPSPYVDPKLVAAIAALERDHDLFESGRVAPDDETAEALRHVVGNHRHGRRPGEIDVAIGPMALPLLYALAFAARTGAPHLPKAAARAAGLLGAAAAGQATVEAGKQQGRKLQAVEGISSGPPPFPEQPRDPKDSREEFPAEGPKLPDRTETPIEGPRMPLGTESPSEGPRLPQQLIFQSLEGDKFTQQLILESRPGGPKTRRLNDELSKLVVRLGNEIGQKMKVLGGGYDEKKNYRPEFWLSAKGEMMVPGRPLKNGSFLDITIEDEVSGWKILINTTNNRKDGQLTRGEDWQAQKVLVNKDKKHLFFTAPKPRSDVDLAEYVQQFEPLIRKILARLPRS